MKALKKIAMLCLMSMIMLIVGGGCSSREANIEQSEHTLRIYCGAGMKKPFQEISDTFKAKTGYNMEVTFANAAQIQTQINTAKEGDLFIAGSSEELKPVKEQISQSKDLVKHIPVLAVQSGNPKAIKEIKDLAKKDIRVVIGDPQSTPIGKIAKKVFEDFKIDGKVDIVSNTTTAPMMPNVLKEDECDAIIVWKENANVEGIERVETCDMEKYIKTVPAASLKYTQDEKALEEFRNYLDSEEAKNIWKSNGYETLE